MKWRASYLLRAMLFQQKASGREELTRRKRKQRIQLAVLEGAMRNEMMEVFEPEEMFQGTRRSYQKGQAMKRCAGAERHHWESETEDPLAATSWRDDRREARGQRPSVTNHHTVIFIRKNPPKWKQHGSCKQSLAISWFIFTYLKSSSKFLLDERKFYHVFWQKA